VRRRADSCRRSNVGCRRRQKRGKMSVRRSFNILFHGHHSGKPYQGYFENAWFNDWEKLIDSRGSWDSTKIIIKTRWAFGAASPRSQMVIVAVEEF
jgi:hypothetical protein